MNILYEDNHLLLVEKPPNLPVQADASGDADLLTLLRAFIKERDHKPGAVYLGLVHRLDRPVGGAMVFCKTSKAAARVSQAIRENRLGKVYLAVAQGQTPPQERLENFLVKDGRTNTVRVCAPNAPGAKHAVLTYETLACRAGLSLICVHLETGRSHQIRVQLSHRGFPLWGDSRYGGGKPGQQIALWSWQLTLPHPTRNETVTVLCPPPEKEPWRQFAHDMPKGACTL